MMKNAFYFILKALFAFEIFRILSLFFGYVEKGLDKIAKINFSFFRVTDWTTKIAMHKLPNISRRKDNQTMTFGQLIKHNRNVFLRKSYTTYVGEASPRPL